MCAIDLSKAFDKVNHQRMFIKLMKRHIPVDLLELLENWLFQSATTCVKWGDRMLVIHFQGKFWRIVSFLFAV